MIKMSCKITFLLFQEYYFAPQKNKAPKGKLLAKYYNNTRKLKSSGLLEGPLVKRKVYTESSLGIFITLRQVL